MASQLPPREGSYDLPDSRAIGAIGATASPKPVPLQPSLNNNNNSYLRSPPVSYSTGVAYPVNSFPPPNTSRPNGSPYMPPLPPMQPGPADRRPMPMGMSAGAMAAKRAATGPPTSSESPAKKKQSKWSAEEDAAIIELRGNGMKWEDISKNLAGRSAISCRLRFQNYLERRSEWDEEKKNKLARLYERFKKDMWEKIAKEMALPWRAAEAMHWQIGEVEMAHRANVAVFHLAGTQSSTPSMATSMSASDLMANTPSPPMMSKSLPSLHQQYDHPPDAYQRYDTRAPTPSQLGGHTSAPEEYASEYRGRPVSRSGPEMYPPPTRFLSPYSRDNRADNGH